MKKTANGDRITLYNRIERCGICGNPIGGVTGRAEAYRLRLAIEGKKRTLYMHISCGDRFIVGKREDQPRKGDDVKMTRTEIEEAIAATRKTPAPDPERVRDLEARRDALRAEGKRKANHVSQ